jgi:hypothetical protein
MSFFKMIIQEQKDNDVDMQDETVTAPPFPVINNEEDLRNLFEKIKKDTGDMKAEPEPSHVYIRHFKVDFKDKEDQEGIQTTVFDGMISNPRFKKEEESS